MHLSGVARPHWNMLLYIQLHSGSTCDGVWLVCDLQTDVVFLRLQLPRKWGDSVACQGCSSPGPHRLSVAPAGARNDCHGQLQPRWPQGAWLLVWCRNPEEEGDAYSARNLCQDYPWVRALFHVRWSSNKWRSSCGGRGTRFLGFWKPQLQVGWAVFTCLCLCRCVLYCFCVVSSCDMSHYILYFDLTPCYFAFPWVTLTVCFYVCSIAGDSLNDCRIRFLTEIYKIEEHGSLGDAPAGSESPLKSMFLNCINMKPSLV